MPSELRKRTDAQRKERTRTRLLNAAGAVFLRKGYHQTLISDIVSEAGVGQGTFYRHFPSKRSIYLSLYDRLFEELLSEFTPLNRRLPGDLREYRDASISLLTRMVAIVESNREVVLLFLREANSVDRAFEEKVSDTYDRFALLAQHYLDHAIQRGFARPCRSDLVAQAIVGISLRMLDLWLRQRIPERASGELVRELVDFAFQGFGKETSHE